LTALTLTPSRPIRPSATPPVTLPVTPLMTPIRPVRRTPPRQPPRVRTLTPTTALEMPRLRDSATPVDPPGVIAPMAGHAGGAGTGTATAPAVGPATTAAGSTSPPLNLTVPREFYTRPPPLTAAQEAMRDPRSNRLVLTKREQIDIDFGLYPCVAWVREPDGTIYRGPGRLQRVQDVGTNPFNGRRGEECVK
jgi:hypothetical protein